MQQTIRKPVPLQWQVNDLQLAGLSWGEVGEKPLLALHGWLDNAASFAAIAPLLSGYHVVALDLTGHGRSARRSADASYHIWDDLPEILGVLQALEWDRFDLLGHSRGAIIATLLASACPERVSHLVLLDAVVPAAVAQGDFPSQMRKALQDKPRLLHAANPVFTSLEEAVAYRVTRGLPKAGASSLVERNLCPVPNGMTWTTDPRLQGASAVKLSDGQIRATLEALTMPTLLLLAQEASRRMPELAALAQRHIDRLAIEEVAGGHHFHMEPAVTDVAQRIVQFLGNADGYTSA